MVVEQGSKNLLSYIKEFDVQGAIAYLKTVDIPWFELISVGGAGFLSGYLLKKYFKILFISSFSVLAMLAILQYFGFVLIEWDVIKTTLGIQQVLTFDEMVSLVLDYIKTHVAFGVVSTVCFVIGYKVG